MCPYTVVTSSKAIASNAHSEVLLIFGWYPHISLDLIDMPAQDIVTDDRVLDLSPFRGSGSRSYGA